MSHIRLDPKAFLAGWPLAAAATFFAFSGGSFAQNAHQVDAPADAAATDTADLPLLINARLDVNNGMAEQADHEVRQYLGKHPNSAKPASKPTRPKHRWRSIPKAPNNRTPSYLDLKVAALDYILLEDYADADKWLSRSLEWNPQDAESWYDLGRIKYNEASFSEARNAFDRCLKLNSETSKRRTTWA
jgi:tetratricopeptide (TPR) repeat protein